MKFLEHKFVELILMFCSPIILIFCFLLMTFLTFALFIYEPMFGENESTNILDE